MGLTYERPVASQEEQEKILRLVGRLVRYPRRDLIAALVMILMENSSLTAEVNAHRAALGYEPLPIFDPDERTNNHAKTG